MEYNKGWVRKYDGSSVPVIHYEMLPNGGIRFCTKEGWFIYTVRTIFCLTGEYRYRRPVFYREHFIDTGDDIDIRLVVDPTIERIYII